MFTSLNLNALSHGCQLVSCGILAGDCGAPLQDVLGLGPGGHFGSVRALRKVWVGPAVRQTPPHAQAAVWAEQVPGRGWRGRRAAAAELLVHAAATRVH